jgi:RNA polymerase sigma factor (sigma-70 family)
MLQEAIIVLWQQVCSGKFKLTAKLSTYLLGVVKNKWRAELRKRSRMSEESAAQALNGNPTALETVLGDEEQEAVHRALEELQPVCKKLLFLFYFEERTLEDIAGIMGFAGTDVVKSRKYQCKKALERILRNYQAEDGRST